MTFLSSLYGHLHQVDEYFLIPIKTAIKYKIV